MKTDLDWEILVCLLPCFINIYHLIALQVQGAKESFEMYEISYHK